MLDLLNPNDKNPRAKSNIVAFGLFVVKFNHAQIIILVFFAIYFEYVVSCEDLWLDLLHQLTAVTTLY